MSRRMSRIQRTMQKSTTAMAKPNTIQFSTTPTSAMVVKAAITTGR